MPEKRLQRTRAAYVEPVEPRSFGINVTPAIYEAFSQWSSGAWTHPLLRKRAREADAAIAEPTPDTPWGV